MNHRPELIVIAGPNGSGKTTITKQLLRHAWAENSLYLNPDEMAQQEFGGWDSPRASLLAAQKAEGIRMNCVEEGRSLVFETVFSAPDKLEYLRTARKAGFFIRLFFICTDSPLINVNRISRRRMKGGHDVPPAKIFSRYSKSISNCAVAMALVDRAYIYDNSINEMAPALLFRAESGVLKKLYLQPVNAWAQSILNRLKIS